MDGSHHLNPEIYILSKIKCKELFWSVTTQLKEYLGFVLHDNILV